MADRNVFATNHVKEKALAETSGLLDQLNLPPGLVQFLRKYQRIIWIVVGCVAVVVTVVSLYTSYRAYQMNKAATALDQAMELQGEERKTALSRVAEEHAATPSALWAQITLAHMAQDEGEVDQAITLLAAVNRKVGSDNPLKPLLLVNLGHLYAQKKDFEQAVATFKALQDWEGFRTEAYGSLGLLYEQHGEREQAKEMYTKYLQAGGNSQPPTPEDETRDLIQSRLNRLEQ